jgi:hypothetical protein
MKHNKEDNIMVGDRESDLIKYYVEKRIKQCNGCAAISKEARVKPINFNDVTIAEYIERKNKEMLGEDCFHNLQAEFLRMKPEFSKIGFSAITLDHIEKEIQRAKSEKQGG